MVVEAETAAGTDTTAPGESSESVVLVQDLEKRYGKVQAVRGMSLEVNRGEIFGLIGPDGAGKSSLLRIVAGILAQDAGQVRVLGQGVDSESTAERIKGRIGFMSQGLGQNLYPELSVEENVDFFARTRLVPVAEAAERKDRLLEATRLSGVRDRPMKQLSGGMKQKLGLVCTLIHRPELIILDEPTTGVDPVSRRDFWAILTDFMLEGDLTALISTAYMDEASRFQRLCLMYGGKAIASGQPDEIGADIHGRVVQVRAEPQAAALAGLKREFEMLEWRGPWVNVFVRGDDEERAVERVRHAVGEAQIKELRTDEPGLEDLFIAMLREQGLSEASTTADAPEPAASPDPPRRAATDGAAPQPAVSAQELVKDFGSFRAVDHVSFSVAPGEVFGLLGANGAGKTTVIKMLVGILPPTEGGGSVAGADIRHAGEIKRSIGYMSQVFSLYGDLRVIENIRLYGGIYGLWGRELRRRVQELVELADLSTVTGQLAQKLPLGIRQRLALACALVHRPRLLFLDEPTSGVDPVGRRRFWDLLFTLSREDQVAVIITTHYMNEAEHCDRLALMHAGILIADDTPAALKQQLTRDRGVLLEIRADDFLGALRALEAAGHASASLHGRAIHLLAPDKAKARDDIQRILADKHIGLESIEERPVSIEDVFVQRILEREAAPEAAGGAS